VQPPTALTHVSSPGPLNSMCAVPLAAPGLPQRELVSKEAGRHACYNLQGHLMLAGAGSTQPEGPPALWLMRRTAAKGEHTAQGCWTQHGCPLLPCAPLQVTWLDCMGS